MWTYFVLRAYNYFVLVLNSLKTFCLSSEQGFNKKSTYQNTEQKALYYKKRRIPIYLTKTALKRTSNAIFNMKIVDLDESWLNR